MVLLNQSHLSYCGWKKSCTTLNGWNPIKKWDKPSTGAESLPSIIFYHFSSFHPGVFTWITYHAVPPKTLNHTLTLHLVLWFMAAKTEGCPEWPELPSIKSDFGWLCLHGMGQGYHHVPPVADYTLNPNVRNGFCSDFVTFHQGHARWNNFKPLWFTTGFLAGYVLFCCLKTYFHFVAWVFFASILTA